MLQFSLFSTIKFVGNSCKHWWIRVVVLHLTASQQSRRREKPNGASLVFSSSSFHLLLLLLLRCCPRGQDRREKVTYVHTYTALTQKKEGRGGGKTQLWLCFFSVTDADRPVSVVVYTMRRHLYVLLLFFADSDKEKSHLIIRAKNKK